MPSQLDKIDLSYGQAESELRGFKEFLQNNDTFSEREVANQLKSRLHLTCLLTSMMTGVPKANRYRFEFQIGGLFRADLVVGNLQEKAFVWVEFEGAEENSLFGSGGTKQLRRWSRQLEHGFGQLVDWAWAKRDLERTDAFKNAFGCDHIRTISLVVCGRDHHMDETEQKRFEWRRRNINISGTDAQCLTYDDLATFFEAQIEAIRSYHDGSPGGVPSDGASERHQKDAPA